MVKNIKAGVPPEALTSIIVTAENKSLLLWLDEREFSYNGTMYDIVHIENISGNKTIYHCLTDKQETKLIAEYSQNLKKNQKNKNSNNNPLKLFKFHQQIEPLTPPVSNLFDTNKMANNYYYTNGYHTRSLEISSPPPQIG